MAIEKTLINKATYESKMDELKAALDNYSNPEAVHLNDTQTITGLKTFATLPQAGTDPSNDADFVPKKYVDDIVSTRKAQEEKCYQALKTVTKDFTRTDPVYVRIGEDGEPEIHVTLSKSNYGSEWLAYKNLGKAHFHIHDGAGVVTSMVWATRNLVCGSYHIHGFANLKNFSTAIYDSTATVFEWDSDAKVTNFRDNRYMRNLIEFPAIDLSQATISGSFTHMNSLTAFHATGMRESFDLSESLLQNDAILEVFNNLGSDVAEGTTLTLGSAKLALMSDEEKKIATDKGWTLA